MKTTFHYKKQETYTQGEMDTLLSQVETVVLKASAEGMVESTELDELKTQLEDSNIALKEYRNKELSTIKDRIGKEVFGDNFDKGSKYVKFEEDFDFTNEEEVKKVFEEVNKDLFSATNNDGLETTNIEVGKQLATIDEDDEFSSAFEEYK